MNLLHAVLSTVALVVALTQQPRGHNAFILVLDRGTNEPIPAEVYVGSWQARTEKGKATFVGIEDGTYRVVIIADDDRYPVVNWSIVVPQTETALYRLERRK